MHCHLDALPPLAVYRSDILSQACSEMTPEQDFQRILLPSNGLGQAMSMCVMHRSAAHDEAEAHEIPRVGRTQYPLGIRCRSLDLI